jgi:hypothetical protein
LRAPALSAKERRVFRTLSGLWLIVAPCCLECAGWAFSLNWYCDTTTQQKRAAALADLSLQRSERSQPDWLKSQNAKRESQNQSL